MAGLLAATAIVYWPGLYGGFIFDDLPNLVQSESWKIGSLTPAAVRQVLDSDRLGIPRLFPRDNQRIGIKVETGGYFAKRGFIKFSRFQCVERLTVNFTFLT